MKNIPYSIVDLSNNDHEIINSIKSMVSSRLLFFKIWEEFKKFTKSKYAITLSSCTAGLHLSCMALGIKKGDEVVVPAQTHAATVHSEYTGAKAVFDIDYSNGIFLNDIEKRLIKNKSNNSCSYGRKIVRYEWFIKNCKKM